MTRSPHSMLIGSKGEIYKCYEELGEKKNVVGISTIEKCGLIFREFLNTQQVLTITKILNAENVVICQYVQGDVLYVD